MNQKKAPHPIEEVGRAVDRVREAVAGSIDPMGMLAPLVHAQVAWLAHPQELHERLAAFRNDLWRLQRHTAFRMLGVADPDPLEVNPEDARFKDPAWSETPSWDYLKEWYLAITRHTQDMLYDTPGLSDKDRRRAAFWWREGLNAIAPSNFFWTNPVAMRKAIESNGESIRRGMQIMQEDLQAGDVRMSDVEGFVVGENLAATPGAVIFRNELMELIHYTPTCSRVHAEPVVIVTPWINKFYVLDLTPEKSMVRYLLDQGLDVFITSWRNPDASMRDTSFDDYVTHGVGAAIDTARAFTGARKVHAVGYCVGGTALAMYTAWANRRFAADDVPVADLTLLTTLVDFRTPGDIEVFIDESSVRYLERNMACKGVLEGKEMATAFRLSRSNSLIWHYVVNGWLYGEKPRAFDVLYWNMDATRLPQAMHSWYLRELYLHNRLVEKDALEVAGERLDLSRITQPLYAVAAQDDHIAPWAGAFRINEHVSGPKRFVLSSSGHILGIINPPVSPPKRSYRVGDPERSDRAEAWKAGAEEIAGSWWEDWMEWLKPRAGNLVKARPTSSRRFPKLAAAPGEYVHQR